MFRFFPKSGGGLLPCFRRLYCKPSFALDSSTCCPWLFWDILYEQWHISIFKDDTITKYSYFCQVQKKEACSPNPTTNSKFCFTKFPKLCNLVCYCFIRQNDLIHSRLRSSRGLLLRQKVFFLFHPKMVAPYQNFGSSKKNFEKKKILKKKNF